MGYRSDVLGLVYGTGTNVDRYIKQHKKVHGDKSVFDLFPAGNNDDNEGITIGTTIRDEVEYKYIKLSGSDWKWYDSYEDVQAWEQFMKASKIYGLEWEFSRIGEEEQDIESIKSGSAKDFVYVVRHIYNDI